LRPYLQNTHHKNRAGGVAQGEGPEFKPQYQLKKKGGGEEKEEEEEEEKEEEEEEERRGRKETGARKKGKEEESKPFWLQKERGSIRAGAGK
jgi:hypothetical protein